MSNEHLHEETELFHRIAEGDETAFRQIFQHYGAVIHPFVLKIVKDEDLAREIVQDVFLKLWIKRESLPGIENPAGWLYRVASNLSISHFRKQELDKRLLKELKQSNQPGADTVDELSAKELRILIKQAVEQLPEKRRRIYQLSRDQGLSRKEVAEQLNISENTVRNQLAISVQFIQEYIKKNSGYYIPVILLSTWGLTQWTP